MPNPMAKKLFEAVWAKGTGDGAEVQERSLLVESKMLEDIWVFNNVLVFDSVLILGHGVEVPEGALLVEAKMLEDIWIFNDVLVLDDALVLEDMVRVEVDLLS